MTDPSLSLRSEWTKMMDFRQPDLVLFIIMFKYFAGPAGPALSHPQLVRYRGFVTPLASHPYAQSTLWCQGERHKGLTAM